MSNQYVFYILITMAIITFCLRALPILLGKIFKDSQLLSYIGGKMAVGVMLLLVIYTLKEENYLIFPYGAPLIIASACAIIIYWRFNNVLLSIFLSLSIYLLWVNAPLLAPLFG